MMKVKNSMLAVKIKPLKGSTVKPSTFTFPSGPIRTITFEDEFLLRNRETCFEMRGDRWVGCKACGAVLNRWHFKEQDDHVKEHKEFLIGKRRPRKETNDPRYKEPNWGFLPMKDLIGAVEKAYDVVAEDETEDTKLEKIFMHGASRLWDKYADEGVDTEKIRSLKGRSIYCDGGFHFVADDMTDDLKACFSCDCEE
jgi:hypothetical protein